MIDWESLLSYRRTVIRILILILVGIIVKADNISSVEDFIVSLGATIVGSVVGEMVVRTVIHLVIRTTEK